MLNMIGTWLNNLLSMIYSLTKKIWRNALENMAGGQDED